MTGNSYYCAGNSCRRTTHRVIVRMLDQTYYYCVECGRRLETRADYERHRRDETEPTRAA